MSHTRANEPGRYYMGTFPVVSGSLTILSSIIGRLRKPEYLLNSIVSGEWIVYVEIQSHRDTLYQSSLLLPDESTPTSLGGR
jgi:hypothetical protein